MGFNVGQVILYLLRRDNYPKVPITVCGGKKFLLPLPFPIFDLVHVQFICFYCTDEQLFTEQLLPGNRITGEENSCYPNSSLPGNLFYRSIFSLHVHHAYFNIAQIIWVLFYSNPPGGRAGVFLNPIVLDRWKPFRNERATHLRSQCCAAIFLFRFVRNCRLFSRWLTLTYKWDSMSGK